MSCKTYQEIIKEVKPYLTEDMDIQKAYKAAREAEYADLADAYVESKAVVVDTLNSALPYYKKQRIEILGIRDTKKGKQITYKYLTSSKQYTLYSGEYSPFTFGREGVTFEATTRELDTLYSDLSFMYEGANGYEERVVMSMNNTDDFYKLGEEIAEMEGHTADTEVLLEKLKNITKVMKVNIGEVIAKVNTEAARTGGTVTFDGDKATVYVGVGPSVNGMTALQAYVHEMVHVVTKLAIDSRDPYLSKHIRNLELVRQKVLSDVTVDMLVDRMAIPDREVAEAMLDYISDSNVGLHEFVAYAETNPLLRDVLESITLTKDKKEYPTLAAKLAGLLQELMENVFSWLTGTKNKNGLEIAEAAVIGLVNANRRAQEVKRIKTLDRVIDKFFKIEGKIVDKIDKYEEAVKRKPAVVFKGDNAFSKLVETAQVAMRATVDEKYKRILEFTASMWGLKPEGTIMGMLRDMSQSDTYQDTVERLGLMSQNIDRQREFIFAQTKKVVSEAFNIPLTKEESEAVTSVMMDTDIAAIHGVYNIEAILSDKGALKEALYAAKGKLKEVAKGTEGYNYFANQAEGLGYYMATGRTKSIAQLLNAEAIAKRLHTKYRQETVSPELVKAIDELATLQALYYTDDTQKQMVAQKYREDANGVNMVVAFQMTHKQLVEKELFKSKADKLKLVKGYSKEVYPADLDFKIASVEDEVKMRKLGYKKVANIESHPLDRSPAVAMYVSELNARQNLHRVALRYTDKGRKGTSIGDKYSLDSIVSNRKLKARRDIATMKLEAAEEAERMNKADFKFSKDTTVLPVLDNLGNIMDFRYVMSKDTKKKLLKMNRDVDTVIGRTYASRYDKEESAKFNDELMDLVEKDAALNYKEGRLLGKFNNKEYVKIEKNSPEAEIRDIWSVLPDHLQSKYPEGFAVRRDLIHSILGYREISLVNFPGVTALPEGVKHSIRVAEKIWKDIVSISKKNIVLKIPAVLIGNITSNLALSVMSGNNPVKTAKLQLQGVRDLNRWIRTQKEILKLESLKAAGRGSATVDRRIGALMNELKLNPATALVDEGFYTTILEELEATEDTNVVTKYASKVMDKMPKLIRNGAELLYLSDSTAIMKFMNASTQYSDFVARYAQYTMLVEKGMDKVAAAKEVRDAYINYNKPNSRALEWANQIGLVMFTKYFTRIQKTIKHQARTHPLTVLAAILAQEWVVGDIDDITDQSILTKDIGNIFYNPMDTFMRAITPMWDDAIKSL